MSAAPLDRLFEALAIPAAARVDQRVAKSLLAERGELGAADKKLVDTGLERLTWRATLKPQNVGVAEYRDADRDYAQIVVMSAALRPEAKAARLAEIIHRAIAHPLVLLAGDEAGATLSVGLKRHHEREAGRAVVERLTVSVPVAAEPDAIAAQFLASLPLATVSAHDLWSLHLGWESRIEAFAAARVTGGFRLPRDPAEIAARRETLVAHAVQARNTAALRKAAMGERRLNRRLDLARDVAKAEADLAQLAERLN